MANSAPPGEAAHDDALRFAEGFDLPQDWIAALDRLATAAGLGHGLARASLAALAGDWTWASRLLAGADCDLDWQALRQRVDIAAWLRTPPMRVLSPSPRVALVEGFASPELCDWLIARTRPLLAPALLYDRDSGTPTKGAARTNREHHFYWRERDLVFDIVRARISQACGLPVGAMEAPTILNYQPGEEFMTHHDYLDPATPGHARNLAAHGQRVLTFLVALNDTFEGGETDFPVLHKRFRGKRGNAFFFWNVEPDGAIDRRTLHAGLPPTKGEKWMLSQWIRDRVLEDTAVPVR